MALFLFSMVVIALVIAAMAVGVLAGRAPIKGSCGGLGALGLKDSCEVCGGKPQRCEVTAGTDRAGKREPDCALYFDASR